MCRSPCWDRTVSGCVGRGNRQRVTRNARTAARTRARIVESRDPIRLTCVDSYSVRNRITRNGAAPCVRYDYGIMEVRLYPNSRRPGVGLRPRKEPQRPMLPQHARNCPVPEGLGTPAGALALRGAFNFQTPPGWDTVYTPVFNMIERPIAPMLIVRVETDWFAHETEFRYVLQPGEGITAAHSMPIGQVFFVPREDVAFRDCSSDEIESLKQSAVQFSRDKAAHKVQTPYGMLYSPQYLKQSRASKK